VILCFTTDENESECVFETARGVRFARVSEYHIHNNSKKFKNIKKFIITESVNAGMFVV